MLKSRIITAVILLISLLLVLFVLPDKWWIVVVVLIVMQSTLEWSKLSKLSGTAAYVYGGLTLIGMLALIWFDRNYSEAERVVLHLMLYSLSALLWLVIVPVWMIAGWKVQNRLLMCLTGWLVIIPTGLAMLDLHASITPPISTRSPSQIQSTSTSVARSRKRSSSTGLEFET